MRTTNESKTDRFTNIPGWFLAVLALGMSAILVVIAVMTARHLVRKGVRNESPIASVGPDMSPFFLEQRASRISESEATRRVVYPYSVIPGGVQNTMELTSAVMHDPVVAGHYSDFDIARAKLVRLDHDEVVHVSYRMNNMIYWTKRTYLLHKGEMLVSDGKHQARTRCGNRVGQVSPANALNSRNEPTPEMLDARLDPETFHAMNLPMLFAMPPPDTDVAIPSGVAPPPGGVFYVPPIILVPGGPAGGKTPPATPPRTPPSTPPSTPPTTPSTPPTTPPGTPPTTPPTTPPATPPSTPPTTPPVTPPIAPAPPVTPTPEPTSLLLVGTGIAAVLRLRKRFKS